MHGLDDWLIPNPGALDQAVASHDLGLGLGDYITQPIADSGLWNVEHVNVPSPEEHWRITTGHGWAFHPEPGKGPAVAPPSTTEFLTIRLP